MKRAGLTVLCALGAAFAAARAEVMRVTEDVTVTDANLAEFTGASGIDVAAGATLTFSPSAAVRLSVPLSGAGAFFALNAGNLTLAGDNSAFTGPFVFTNTALTVGHAAALGRGNPVCFAGTNNGGTNKRLVFGASGVYSNPIVFGAADVTSGEHHMIVDSGCCVTNTGLLTLDAYCRLDAGHSGYAAWGGGVRNLVHHWVLNGKTEFFGDAPIEMSGKIFYFDSGTMRFGSSGLANASTFLIAKGTVVFEAANLLSETQRVQMGIGYGPQAAIDLNGFDQRCGEFWHQPYLETQTYKNVGAQTIRSDGPATFTIHGAVTGSATYEGFVDGAASLALAGRTTRLTIDGGVTGRGPATAGGTTTGALSALNGASLTLGANVDFPNLGGLVASNSSTLVVNTSRLNPAKGFALTLADDAKLTVGDGVELVLSSAVVDGASLAPGVYMADSQELNGHVSGMGRLVVRMREGAAFLWVGGSDGNALASAANWAGGAAPAFDGTERLVFGAGSGTAVVSGVVDVYAIDVATNAPFTLAAADADAKIRLRAGGLSITNTAAEGTVAHSIACPIELAELPQTWLVAPNATFENNAPISSGESPFGLAIRSFGRTNFRADNFGLLATLLLTNCSTTAGQPYVHNPRGLGSASRPTRFEHCWPRFQMPANVVWTNETPLDVHRGHTGQCGYTGSRASGAKLVQLGEVRAVGTSEDGLEAQVRLVTEWRGGITSENGQSIGIRFDGLDQTFLDTPIRTTGRIYFDYGGTVTIATTNNSWSEINPYKNTIKCGCAYAMATNGVFAFADNNVVYLTVSNAVLDLNGYDQRIARVRRTWSPWNNLNSTYPIAYGRVRSDAPATLTLATDVVCDDWIPLAFEGAAGLRFDSAGTLAFTNRLSTTAGALEVLRGTVRFLAGAGWTSSSNVVINGGAIAVAAGAGATAFGTDGKSIVGLVRDAGTLDVAEGEQATVRTLGFTMANGRIRYSAPGVYGGPDAGLSAAWTLDWMTGRGTLRVLRNGSDGTLLLLR